MLFLEYTFNNKYFRMQSATILDDALTLLLLNKTCHVLANSVDQDQLASEEANWSGSTLFVIIFEFLSKKKKKKLIK